VLLRYDYNRMVASTVIQWLPRGRVHVGCQKARKTPESALSTTPTALVRLRRATPANNAVAANTTVKIAHQGALHTIKKTAAFTVLNAEELSSQMLDPSGAYVKEVLRVQKDASAQQPTKSM